MKYVKLLYLLFPILIVITMVTYYFESYTFKYIDGTIISKNDEYIEIITDNDSIYKFKYKLDKYNTGDNISIKYNKSLNDFKETQDIDIVDIRNIKSNLNYSRKTISILNDMTIDEKIGQLMLVRTPDINQLDTINNYNIGGYILFKRDVDGKSKQDLINYIKSFQDTSKIPLLIAIDEEGGIVSRLSYNKMIVDKPFLSPQELYNNGGYDKIKEDSVTKVKLLKELGINLNLAPVADIVTDSNSYMFDRSFGSGINGTSKFIKTILETQTKDVSFTLKHFPGYGNNSDTHTDITVDNRSYKELKYKDFIPFNVGINNGAKTILVSHNIVKSIEDKPASISRNMHNILRNKLNYNGVIITDDLDMDGINKYSTNTPYIDAILAGNNILIVSDYKKAYLEIKQGIDDGIISEELIDRLILKNIQLKLDKNLMHKSYCTSK